MLNVYSIANGGEQVAADTTDTVLDDSKSRSKCSIHTNSKLKLRFNSSSLFDKTELLLERPSSKIPCHKICF